MILIKEIAEKLEKVLNGTDEETASVLRPTDLYFKVETTGFHIDHVIDKQQGRNFIPVFVHSVGGDFDPVIQLKRSSKTIAITLYFPVRFKEQMYALEDYLFTAFVGQLRNYGGITGKCLSNITPGEFGELQELDLKQYQSWVEDRYQETVDIQQPWMTMSLRLSLQNAAEGFIYANNITYNLQFTVTKTIKGLRVQDSSITPATTKWIARAEQYDITYQDNPYYAFKDYNTGLVLYARYLPVTTNTLYELEDGVPTTSTRYTNVGGIESDHEFAIDLNEQIAWTQGGSGVSNSPIAQQLINGTNEYAKNVINITNYEKSIVAYFKTSDMWLFLLDAYCLQEMDTISALKLIKTYKLGEITKTYEYNQVLLSLNENQSLGSLLSFTLAFGDR